MQISLVWNARDEDSVQSEKLHKMTEVIQTLIMVHSVCLIILKSFYLSYYVSCQFCKFHLPVRNVVYLIIVPFSDAVEEG